MIMIMVMVMIALTAALMIAVVVIAAVIVAAIMVRGKILGMIAGVMIVPLPGLAPSLRVTCPTHAGGRDAACLIPGIRSVCTADERKNRKQVANPGKARH